MLISKNNTIVLLHCDKLPLLNECNYTFYNNTNTSALINNSIKVFNKGSLSNINSNIISKIINDKFNISILK